MLSICDHAQLAANLDHFPVPMFATERQDKTEPFRFICVNAAHTRVTGLTTKQVYGRRPEDVLPENDAKAVNRRYNIGIKSEAMTSYRETLLIQGKLTTWDTTLQKVIMPDARERLIGTSLAVNLTHRLQAISDVEYFTARAQMQLGQVQSYLQTLESYPDLPSELSNGAQMTNRLTHALQETLADLRISMPTQRIRTVSEAPTLRLVE